MKTIELRYRQGKGRMTLNLDYIFETRNGKLQNCTKVYCRKIFKVVNDLCWMPEERREFYESVEALNHFMANEFKDKYMRCEGV